MTSIALALGVDAVITNVAGAPSATVAAVDWIVSAGHGGRVTPPPTWNAVRFAAVLEALPVRAACVAAPVPGGPMMTPALDCAPIVYPVDCVSVTVAVCAVTGVAPG